MSKGKQQPLSGFRDNLPEEMIPLRGMLSTIAEVFESFGFSPLDTPAIERASVLLGKYGDEGDKLLYRFEDNGGRDVALRYDLTVPLARVVATHTQLSTPFRRYQIGKVWRAERPGRGRFREFTQCDVDIVGAPSMVADAECLQVICAVLQALGVDEFLVQVNNRKVLNSLLARFGVEGTQAVHGSLRILDKLDKIGVEKVQALLVSEAGWVEDDAQRFLQLVTGGMTTVEAELPADDLGRRELEELLALTAAAGLEERVVVNLSIARGLDYYTGTIYETFLTRLDGFGSVMSGGRYDSLLGELAGRELPAVGVSLGISRLFAGLQELELVEGRSSAARVLVACYGPETMSESFAVAAQLRAAGIPTAMFPGVTKLGKQFRYAHRIGALAVCVVGPDEAALGQVTVKWMDSGEQQTVPQQTCAELVAQRLKA